MEARSAPKREKPPLAPRPLVPSLFHGRCGAELLGQPLPGTAIPFTGLGRGRPPALTVPVAAELPRAQALLAAGAEGTSGLRQGGQAGGDGQTDVSSRRRLPRLRARTLPQRRPAEARRGRGHRRLGRCGGLLRGGERGSGRFASPARPGRAAEA